MAAKRKHLTLEDKVKIISYAEEDPKVGIRAIAGTYGVGKTQVSDILRNKVSIKAAYDSNFSTHKKCRISKYCDVNEALYSWYILACSKNIYPNGPQLAAKAKEIAQRFGKTDFEGTPGWLSKWKARYNIRRMKVSGESGDVSGESVRSWKERLSEILKGYKKEDIYNFDETGCFWRALPDSGFGEKGRKCKGGKSSKHRFTIAFMVSASGTKEKPIVIWKSEKPRCFKGFDIDALPVKYYHQHNSWMTGEILMDYLTGFNLKMKAEKRSVLLLLDNAGCHPPQLLQDKFSNIKIIFLPANTTSVLQPLDLGVIQNFKVQYRRHFLEYVLAKIDAAATATDVTKSVNVLTALRWVAIAWREVKPTTVQKCFRRAGILDTALDVQRLSEDEDPFQDIDIQAGMSSLISHSMGTLGHCSVDEYIDGDNTLPTCVDVDGEDWDESWLNSLTAEPEPASQDSDDEDEELDLPPPQPKLKSFKQAMESLEDVRVYLEHSGFLEQASTTSSLISELASCRAKSLVQSTLDQYFTLPHTE